MAKTKRQIREEIDLESAKIEKTQNDVIYEMARFNSLINSQMTLLKSLLQDSMLS